MKIIMDLIKNIFIAFLLLAISHNLSYGQDHQRMDKTWGGQEAPLKEADAHRGEIVQGRELCHVYSLGTLFAAGQSV